MPLGHWCPDSRARADTHSSVSRCAGRSPEVRVPSLPRLCPPRVRGWGAPSRFFMRPLIPSRVLHTHDLTPPPRDPRPDTVLLGVRFSTQELHGDTGIQAIAPRRIRRKPSMEPQRSGAGGGGNRARVNG